VAASTAIRPDLVRVILQVQQLQQEVWQHLWVMVNRMLPDGFWLS